MHSNFFLSSSTVQSVPTAPSIRFLFKTGRLFLFRRLCRSGFRKFLFFNVPDFLFFFFLQGCFVAIRLTHVFFVILFFFHIFLGTTKAFCEKAPASVRASFAFRIYGNFKSYFRLLEFLSWHSFSQKFRFRQRRSINSLWSRETYRFLNMRLREFPEIVGTGRSRRLCKFLYITLEKKPTSFTKSWVLFLNWTCRF